jgi:hypothetical protein
VLILIDREGRQLFSKGLAHQGLTLMISIFFSLRNGLLEHLTEQGQSKEQLDIEDLHKS